MSGRDAPPAAVAVEAGGATAYVVPVPEHPDAADLALLAADELERAGRYHRALDRAAFVTARAAARRCLAPALGVAPGLVPLVRDDDGRPRLAGPAGAAIDFNVSHSGGIAVVAVARGRRVGVDVEWRGADRPLALLVPDVMGARERDRLRGLEGPALARRFYGCWTRKEAIAKGIGLGLAYPVAELDVADLPPDGVVRVPAAGPGRRDEPWTVRTVELAGDFTLSIALAGAGGAIAIVGGATDVCHEADVTLLSPRSSRLYSSTPWPTIL